MEELEVFAQDLQAGVHYIRDWTDRIHYNINGERRTMETSKPMPNYRSIVRIRREEELILVRVKGLPREIELIEGQPVQVWTKITNGRKN